MKKVILILIGIIAAFVLFFNSNQQVHGNRTGAPAGKTGSPGDGSSCNSCHNGSPVSNSANASITSTIPSTGYVPGQTYTVTATVTGANGRFGFEISPQNTGGTKIGTLVITDATNTQLISSNKYITHKSAGTTGTGSRVWTFDWTAPTAGTGAFTFYGSLMAANNNNSDNGDTYYLEQLAVNEAAQINTQPANVTQCAGNTATFTVSATGTGITYQWKKNGLALTNNGHYSGVTTNTLTISSTTSADSDSYTCEVTGSGNTVVSNAVTLTVNDAAAISAQPVSQNACTGSNVTFTVGATGTGLTYVWKKGTTVVGTNSPTLTINGLVAGDAGNYTCTVTGTCGSAVVSNVAVLTINSSATIAQQPTNQTICEGGALNLSVVGNGGNNTTYQWTHNNQPVGSSLATYTVNNATNADIGTYQVTINGSCGSITSNAVTVSMAATTVVNNIATSQQGCAGGNINLSVSATGSNLSYQWYKDNVILPGETNPSLIRSNINSSNGGAYSVIVTGDCGTVNAPISTITINDPPQIISAVAPEAVCQGNNLLFNAQATGTNLTYQWQLNGVDIPNSNQTSYLATNPQNGDVYTFVAWNTCDTVTAPLTATVYPAPVPVITIINGDSLTTTEAYLSYEWYYEDALTDNPYNPVITADNIGNYFVSVMNGFGCTAMSDTFYYNPTAIVNIDAEARISLFPNPANGIVFIKNAVSGQDYAIRVLNTFGQIVLQLNTVEKSFDISLLPKGIYTIQISNGAVWKYFKMIKE